MLLRVTIDAFAHSPEVADVFKAVRDDHAFAKSRLEVLAGGLPAAIEHYQHKPSPQVIVVEAEGDEAAVLAGIDALAEVVEPGTRVIVIGALNDIKLYRALTDHGVSEYLLRPLAPRQLIDVVLQLFADPGASPKGRLITVWGARGGVGASTLAQNLAWTIGRGLPEAPIYLDLDLAFGTSLLAFNLEARQTVAEALSAPERLDAVLLDRFLAAYDNQLRVLPSAGDLRHCPPIGVEAVDTLLEQACRAAPVVVADLPHQWTDWVEHALVVADDVVVVATPDLAALRDTKALLEVLATRRGGRGTVRVLLNKVDAAKKTQLTAKDFEETLAVKPALALPFDPALFGLAANNGQMLAEAGRAARVVQMITEFAHTLVAPAARKAVKPRSLLDWLRK